MSALPAGAMLAVLLARGDLARHPWYPAHERVADGRDRLAGRLGELGSRLRLAALAGDRDQLRRLERAPAAPRPTGWGLLPEIEPEKPEEDGRPWESCYDLEELAAWVEREQAGVAALEREAMSGRLPLAEAVDRFLAARENWDRIDQHVAYHEFWQTVAADNPGFFAGRNALLADYRTLTSPAHDEPARRRREAARERLEDDLLGFRPLAGPRLVDWPDGSRVLRVEVATDIGDERFLAVFSDAVRRSWNGARAMRESRLEIDLVFLRRRPAALYPEGPPRRGDAIDLAAHRRRFAADLVLTTGAASTHAVEGAVFLGTAPLTPRTLAHEFGHLLGFSDGYLRASAGSPHDPWGVLLIEVGPFPASLMASPATGRVTPGMVRRLLEGYGPRPPTGGSGP